MIPMAESHPVFVHLRTHTAYSLSEGALQIKALAGLAKDARMPAVAITDTGNLFGALEFSEAMWDKGIQPIVGTLLAPVTSFLTFYVLILSIAKGDPKSFEVIAKSNPDSAVAL